MAEKSQVFFGGRPLEIDVRLLDEAQELLVDYDEQITEPILQTILTNAGRYKGLGDWRPGGKTPGTFGMFKATVEPEG